jgi:ribosome-binding protein aMBF1 (putative translation factor)
MRTQTQHMAAAAARRVHLETPPSDAVEAEMKRQQLIERKRIGANIKKARAEAGLSLRQMQQRSSVHANYLSELERGLRAATVDVLVQIAFHLNTTISALVSE